MVYYVFFWGYKLAVFRYVKGVDYSSGSMYTALVPDAYMDYLESTYSTTRREVKSMMSDYFDYWNENYGTEGRMSYDIGHVQHISDADELAALEDELHTSYDITVEISKAVEVSLTIDDGGTKASEKATFVKIGSRWCCMKAMEDMDYVTVLVSERTKGTESRTGFVRLCRRTQQLLYCGALRRRTDPDSADGTAGVLDVLHENLQQV